MRRLLGSWWFWVGIALVLFIGLVLVFGPKALSLLVSPVAALLSWGAIGLGADRQEARPGRPRRGGTGGSPTKKKGVVRPETSTPGQDELPVAPARPNRPARPGF